MGPLAKKAIDALRRISVAEVTAVAILLAAIKWLAGGLLDAIFFDWLKEKLHALLFPWVGVGDLNALAIIIVFWLLPLALAAGIIWLAFHRGKLAGSTISPAAAPSPVKRKDLVLPKLKDLFYSDFGGSAGELGITLGCAAEASVKIEEKEDKITLPYNIHIDTASHSRFLSFYIPHTPHTLTMCKLIAVKHKEWLAVERYMEWGGPHKIEEGSSRDIMFTGRVYIYHETAMSLQQMAAADAALRAANLKPEFRSTSYALLVGSSRQSRKNARQNA
jgi:hypothetical protein